MPSPPDNMIAAAIEMARRSPCEKSKRGAVAYRQYAHAAILVGEGNNGPPPGFQCDGSEACRADCRYKCIHAEIRALRAVNWTQGLLSFVHVVHVKVVGGELFAGGGPSCLPCSKEMLDLRIGGVWLYEKVTDPVLDLAATWKLYSAEEFHKETVATLHRRGDLKRRY